MAWYGMVCCAVLCCAVLCCIMLCCVVLHFVALCCIMLCYVVLCYVLYSAFWDSLPEADKSGWAEASGPKKRAAQLQENPCAKQHSLGDWSKDGSKCSLREDFVDPDRLENRNKESSAHSVKQKHAGAAHGYYTSTFLMPPAQAEAAKWSLRLFLIRKCQSSPAWRWQMHIYMYASSSTICWKEKSWQLSNQSWG